MILLAVGVMLIIKGILIGYKLSIKSKISGQYDSRLIDLRTFVYVKCVELNMKVPRLVLVDAQGSIATAFYSLRQSEIVLDKMLLDHYSPREVRAVILHELGHLKMNHSLIKIFLSELLVILLFAVVFSTDSLLLLATCILLQQAASGWFSRWINHLHEYQADAFSAQFGFHYDLISFFNKSLKENEGDWASKTHPKYQDRIKKLESMPSKVEIAL